MRRVRQAALMVAAGFTLGLVAGTPAEPELNVTPAWQRKATYVPPNKHFAPGKPRFIIGTPPSFERYRR